MFCGKCGKDMGDAVSFCPHCGAPIKNNGKGEKNMKDKTYNIKDANGNKNGHHRSPVGKWIAVIIAVVVISAAAMLLNQRKPDHPQKGTETAESKESSETVQSTEAAETEQTKDVLMSYLQDTLIPAEGQISSVDEIRSYQLAGTSAADEDKTLVIPDGIAASFIKDMDGDGTEELHILRNEQKTENDDDYDFTYNCIFWEVYVCEDGKVSQVCSHEIIKYQATYEMLNGVWLQKDASDAMQLIFSSDENSVRYYTTISNGSEYTTNYSLENDELKVDVVNLDGNDVTTLYFDLTYSEEENIKILTIQHSEKDDDIDTGALYGFDDLMDGTYVQVKESWVRKQLNVPEEADVSIFQREAYYWDAAQIYVRYFEIIEDDDTVATADVNALTGELAREISPYHH